MLGQEADKCEFTDVDRELITQIITGCRSSKFRRRALEKQLKLAELIELARSLELSEERAGELEDGTTAVRWVSSQAHTPQSKFKKANNSGKPTDNKGLQNKTNQTPSTSTQCGDCGYNYPHKGDCPAKGKICNKCHKLNHFASVCRVAANPDIL